MTELKANMLALAAAVTCIGIQSWRQLYDFKRLTMANKNIITINPQNNAIENFETFNTDTCKRVTDPNDLLK